MQSRMTKPPRTDATRECFFYVDVLIPSYLENRRAKKYARILSSQSLFVVNLVTT